MAAAAGPAVRLPVTTGLGASGGSLVMPTPPGPAPVPGVPFLDGTYSGYGTSPRGDVEVGVTIQGGQIGAVEITRCMTQYPESAIAKLPAQVMARQSALIDRVSGATYSTQAFQQAVQQALARAQGGA